MSKKTVSALEAFLGSGKRPGLLGRNFQLEGEAETYMVMGLTGRSKRVVLQAASDEATLYLPEEEFVRRASRVDD